MKKILFVLSLLASLVAVSCKNPSTVIVEPEDKSPYEYVKPSCVDLENDYTLVGVTIFSDLMNFTDWKYSNSANGYMLAFKKVARVKCTATRGEIRFNKFTLEQFDMMVGTKYEVYLKNSLIPENNGSTQYIILNSHYSMDQDTRLEEMYDGSQITIVMNPNGDLEFYDNVNHDKYVEY